MTAGLNLLPAPDAISPDRWIGMKGFEKGRTCKTMKNNASQGFVMEPETQMNIAYAVAGLTLLGMVWFITQRAKSNRSTMLASNAPKVAGDDELEGGARNPQQFDEPDEDALEEMAKLLGEDDDSADEA
jgi:hypothetical protein